MSDAETVKIAMHGAAGRMGQRIVALAAADPAFTVTAALERTGHPELGGDVGLIAGAGPLGVTLTDDWWGDVDVVIDFSVPQAALALVERCVARKTALVLATTGFEEHDRAVIRRAAESIPLLWSPSMSLAVNLVMKLSAIAAKALREHPSGVDVEIIERHHRFKEDSPSGTALKFGQIIAEAAGLTTETHGRHGRPGVRPRNEIGYHAVRTGDNPGEHTIVFGLLGETIELAVRATSRDCYAQGALAAAKFLAGKPPGLYGIEDVLGLQ